jgi:hypothetical protein
VLQHGPVENPPDMYYVLWVQKYIRSGCRLQVNPVGVICPVGDILWDTFYVMWVLFFILWTTLFTSCGEHVSCLCPVENISCGERHPQVFSTGHVSNLILWVYPVESLSFTDVRSKTDVIESTKVKIE